MKRIHTAPEATLHKQAMWMLQSGRDKVIPTFHVQTPKKILPWPMWELHQNVKCADTHLSLRVAIIQMSET